MRRGPERARDGFGPFGGRRVLRGFRLGRGVALLPCQSQVDVAAARRGLAARRALLDHPATPVYDETHVGRFLGWYHERAFFFDVHGPFAKLSMYWSAVTLGYDGRNSCPYESAEPYVASCDMLPQRLLPPRSELSIRSL